MEKIINSLLENDMYKFSMGQAIYHQFSDYKTTWSFKCRNEDVKFTSEMVEEIDAQIQAYCHLKFTEDELDYLENITKKHQNVILTKTRNEEKNGIIQN